MIFFCPMLRRSRCVLKLKLLCVHRVRHASVVTKRQPGQPPSSFLISQLIRALRTTGIENVPEKMAVHPSSGGLFCTATS